MPFGDRTGPAGLGPMTGRGAGYCAGYGMPGYANPMYGRGGFRGRGFRHWYYATGLPGWQRAAYWMPGGHPAAYGAPPYPYPAAAVPPEHELQQLKDQAQHLEKALEEIHRRITDLEKEEQEA